MPEGAEVRRCGDVIRDVILHKIILLLKPVSGKLLKRGIKGNENNSNLGSVISVQVKGKAIVIETSTDKNIISTLGMAGWWYPATDQLTPDQAVAYAHYNNTETVVSEIIHTASKFTRAQIICTDGSVLNYSDTRNFGNLYVTDTEGVHKKLKSLGPDLLNEDVTTEQWMTVWRTTKNGERIIGEALLEQSLFCGLGNIYRAEACYLAGIYPFAKVKELTDDQLHNLLVASRHVLDVAYRNGSAKYPGSVGYSMEIMNSLFPPQRALALRTKLTTKMNMTWDQIVNRGHYGRLMVYGQSKSPVGEEIQRDVLGGRTIWFVT